MARRWMWMSAVLLVLATSCAHAPAPRAGVAWQGARQLVLVTTTDWNADHGVLRHYARPGMRWRQVGPEQPVLIGRAGSAWGIGLHPAQHDGPQKQEGDGRAPAGVFGIGEAFGYGPAALTALPYEPMQATDYCVDVSGSPLYNRIVDTRRVGEPAVAGATEPMRRDLHAGGDQRYRLGFVIHHNAAGVAMRGSCIFAHIWKSPQDATSGCTAMAPASMERLLSWLRPDAKPIFVLLPLPELHRLHATWGLPDLSGAPDRAKSRD